MAISQSPPRRSQSVLSKASTNSNLVRLIDAKANVAFHGNGLLECLEAATTGSLPKSHIVNWLHSFGKRPAYHPHGVISARFPGFQRQSIPVIPSHNQTQATVPARTLCLAACAQEPAGNRTNQILKILKQNPSLGGQVGKSDLGHKLQPHQHRDSDYEQSSQRQPSHRASHHPGSRSYPSRLRSNGLADD